MTAIFTRNIIIFVLCAIMAKYAIGVHTDIPMHRNDYQPHITKIDNLPLAKKITTDESSTEKYCLSTATEFPMKNNNFIGTVNIASQDKYVYNTKDLQLEQCYAKDTISLPNIISENKLIIKVSPEQSKIIDKRISKSSDVSYIVNGTALEEIQNTSGILKIEKSQLKSSQCEYYLLELPSGSGLNAYGEGFMSRIDKIRKFANM